MPCTQYLPLPHEARPRPTMGRQSHQRPIDYLSPCIQTVAEASCASILGHPSQTSGNLTIVASSNIRRSDVRAAPESECEPYALCMSLWQPFPFSQTRCQVTLPSRLSRIQLSETSKQLLR